MRYKTYSLIAFLTVGFTTSSAAPDSSDALRESKMIQPIEKKSPLPQLEYKVTDSKHLAADGKTVRIKGFRFVGNTVFEQKTLESFISEYSGRELNFNQIDALVMQVTEQYRKAGYFVARAYLPTQEITDGILTIGIVEGHFDEIRLANGSPVDVDVSQHYIDAIDKEKAINIDDTERAVLLINELPRLRVSSARLSPGKTTGTSILDIETASDALVDGYVSADNFGSRYTGYNRIGLESNLNSLLKQGDKISVGGMVSEGKGLESGHIDLEIPLGGSGLSGRVSGFKTLYELGKEYQSLDAHGTAKGYEVSVNYPIKKTRLESIEMDMVWKHQQLADYIDSINTRFQKNSHSFKVGLGWEKEDTILGIDGKTVTAFSWTNGNVKYADEADAAASDMDGKFNKIEVELSRLSYLSERVNLNVFGRGQWVVGDKNLDGSEEFSIGGANGVRFFAPGEQNGDNGYIVGAELMYRLSSFGGAESMLSLFTETGRTWQETENSSEDSSRSLHDVGIGYYLNYGNFFLKSFVSKQIGNANITSDKEYQMKWLIQGGMVF